MAPVLILQVLFFPIATSWMIDIWIDSRRQIALQEVADHLGSLIQQIYFSLNRENMHGRVTHSPDLPKFIENYAYTARGILKNSTEQNTSKILELNVTLRRVGDTVKTSIILGSNVIWNENSVYVSNSTSASIIAEKFPNGTLRLTFG